MKEWEGENGKNKGTRKKKIEKLIGDNNMNMNEENKI